MKVSIIIPVFNEEKTISKILDMIAAAAVSFEKELIVIEDGSTDNSLEILKRWPNITLITHKKNLGKGASMRDGIAVATGDIVLFQDADLEYSPAEYEALLRPLKENTADVVYGSRFLNKKNKFFIHTYLANKFLSFLTRMLTPLPITDMESCYKVFRADILKSLKLSENRFSIEPEITMGIASVPGIRYVEVPISYHGRSIKEGKKVRWHDGAHAIWCLLKYKCRIIFS